MADDSVSKKKQKALLFRKSKEERKAEKAEKEQRKAEEAQAEAAKAEKKAEKELKKAEKKAEKKRPLEADEQPVKKRKTRRGKKGKGVNNGSGPRFILFIGNLPYDTQQAELDQHFKKAQPDRIRLRKDKGIAFLEFDHDGDKMQSKMDHALGMHHSVFRDRKINVELTVGGGGNSENRALKLKEKNEKLLEERRQKARKEEKKRADKRDAEPTVGGMHPARAALLKGT